MIKGVCYVATIVSAIVLLLYVLRCWSTRDAQVLSSFESLEELRTSDVGAYAWETAFRQGDKDFVGVRYHLRKLPPRFVGKWITPVYMPCLVFDANGRCVDKSRNYNDDHLFIHRWPSLFPGIESCKCGRAIDAKEEQKK